METIFETKLNNDEKEILLVKFLPDSNYKKIIEFVVSYRSLFEGRYEEIIRFDGSLREKPHVHKFYLNKKQKQFIEEEFSFELVERCVNQIKRNWHKYKLEYVNKRYL
jgi:hypothetical protein